MYIFIVLDVFCVVFAQECDFVYCFECRLILYYPFLAMTEYSRKGYLLHSTLGFSQLLNHWAMGFINLLSFLLFVD